MATITDVGNVNESILAILLEKGFQVWSDNHYDSYWAEKDGWDFNVDSLPSLLGLVSVYEYMTPREYEAYWWKNIKQVSMESIPLINKEYVPVYSSK